jgi:hypothetical protein
MSIPSPFIFNSVEIPVYPHSFTIPSVSDRLTAFSAKSPIQRIGLAFSDYQPVIQ